MGLGQSWVPGCKVWAFPFIPFVLACLLRLGTLVTGVTRERTLSPGLGLCSSCTYTSWSLLVLRGTAEAAGLGGSPSSASGICVFQPMLQSLSWAFASLQQCAFQVLCV